VSGDDEVMVEEALSEEISQLRVGYGNDVELFSCVAGEIDIREFLGSGAQAPMFARAIVLVVRRIDRLSDEDGQRCVDALEQIAADNHVLLSAAGSVKKSLAAYLKTQATSRETKLSSDRSREGYVVAALTSSGLRLSPDAKRAVIDALGNDVGMVHSVLSVVGSSFAPGLLIDADDLEPYLPKGGDLPPWKLTQLIEGGKTVEALAMLERMMVFDQKPAPLLLSVLTRYFCDLAALGSTTLRTAEAQNGALVATGGKAKAPFVVTKLHGVATRLTLLDYQRVFQLLSESERSVRGGSALSALNVMELLVARLSEMMRTRLRAAPTGSRGAKRA
jgi:DNA polymerase III delta subunit